MFSTPEMKYLKLKQDYHNLSAQKQLLEREHQELKEIHLDTLNTLKAMSNEMISSSEKKKIQNMEVI